MTVRSFFDTNVLVYTDDQSSPHKKARALELLKEHHADKSGVVSLQILQEYFVNATKKLGVLPEIARQKINVFAKLEVGVPDLADILAAVDLHRLHQFSYWDALVIRMAQQTGCKVLYTEDLQHRREIEGLRIVNPFAS